MRNLLGKKRSFGTANKKEIYPSQEEINTNKGLSGAGAQYFITDANGGQLSEINNNIDALINRVKGKENNL